MKPVSRISILLALGVLASLPRASRGQPRSNSSPQISSSTDTGSVGLCDEDGTSAHYLESLSGSGLTMVRYVGSNTGCPNHVNWDINPNSAQENPTNESIPAYPMLAGSNETTDLSSSRGSVGIMRNGVALFSPWAAETVVTYEETAFYLEQSTFDLCGGHATAGGIYHYHSTAGCLQEQAMVEAGTRRDEHSALLGWAYDGFPVYGQLGPDGVEMKMCGEDGADATVCLDICSGYEALVPGVDEFAYRYYTSCGYDESFFPYTTNCYRGCCPDGVECSDKVEACRANAVDGYSADYVPTVAAALDVHYDADLILGDDTDFIDSEFNLNCSLYMGSLSSATSTASGLSPAPTLMASPAPMAEVMVSPAPTVMATAESPAPSSASPAASGATGATPAPIIEEPTPAPSANSSINGTPSPAVSDDGEPAVEDSGAASASGLTPLGIAAAIFAGVSINLGYPL